MAKGYTPEQRSIIASRILKARESAGLTQMELQRRVGLKNQMVYYYETQRRMPSGSTMARIARELGVSYAWLLGEDLPQRDTAMPEEGVEDRSMSDTPPPHENRPATAFDIKAMGDLVAASIEHQRVTFVDAVDRRMGEISHALNALADALKYRPPESPPVNDQLAGALGELVGELRRDREERLQESGGRRGGDAEGDEEGIGGCAT